MENKTNPNSDELLNKLFDDTLLKSDEVSKLLQVGITTLHAWRQNNKGPSYYVIAPRVIRYSKKSVDMFLKNALVEK